MKNVIQGVFAFIDTLFQKVPFMKKLEGYRSIIGLVGMAVVMGLQKAGVGTPEMLENVNAGLLIWTGLALNSKGRSDL